MEIERGVKRERTAVNRREAAGGEMGQAGNRAGSSGRP